MHARPDNSTIVRIGQKLAEAGSVLSISILGVCLVGQVYAWLNYRRTFSLKSQKVYITESTVVFTEEIPTDNIWQILTGNLIVKPLLCLRLVYFCLAIFNPDRADKIWNPLTGSMAALVCMALVPEFVTVIVFLWVGFKIDFKSTVDDESISSPEGSGLKKCEKGK